MEGRRCNIGEVSSLHILVVGNVITVRLQEGDYGNPFVLNYLPWWWNGIHDRLKIYCPQGREGSTPSQGTKDLENRNIFIIFVIESSLILLFYIWRVSDLD